MKCIIVVILVVICFSGCNYSQEIYDNGYRDAWEGKLQLEVDDQYVKGYEEGRKDVKAYSAGYRDAQLGKAPQPVYRKKTAYEKGYDDAKEGKKPIVGFISL